jgi:integrase
MRKYEERVQLNGKVLIRVVVGYDGVRPLRKSKTFPAGTPTTEFEAWANSLKTSSPSGNPKAKTPDAIIKLWLEDREKHVSERTFGGYQDFTRLYLLGRLQKFDKKTIANLLTGLRRQDNGLPLAPKTVEKVRVMVSMILTFAVEEGYIQSAPKLPKSTGTKRKKDIRVLSIQQSDTLRDALREAGEIELETLLLTGLRISELLALEPKHVLGNAIRVEQSLLKRWGYREVGPPKSLRSYRTLKVPDHLAERLSEHNSGGQFLFTLGPTGLRKRLRKYCSQLSLPDVNLHQLRHSHCTYLLAQGVNVAVVSERLGHHSVGFTLDTYSHLIPSMDDALMRALG